MNVTAYETKENNSAQMTVAVETSVFNAAVDSVYKRKRGGISVPGFRKGKAPRKMIESMYGKSVFYNDALDDVVPAACSFGIKEKDLRTVGYPTVEDIQINDDLSADITFNVDLYPVASLGEYKGIEAVKPLTVVEESEIDADIETMRLRNARTESVERPAINGDTVVIDYDGYLDGVPFEGGKAEMYELVLGSNSFIQGFEQKIQGMTVGEERDLELTFPEAYHADALAGKDVIFKVKLHEVKSKILPDADDEFVKDISEFDTIAEYRADVRARLEKEKGALADAEFENNVLEVLAARVEAEIPESMYDEQVDANLRNMASQLGQYGIGIEQYFAMQGMSEADARAQMRPQATTQVRTTLALEKIAELENINPAEEEIEATYVNFAERYDMPIEEVREGIERESIVHDLQLKGAIKVVTDNAVALPPPPPEAEADEASEEPAAAEEAPAPKPKAKRSRAKKTEEPSAEEPKDE